MTIKFDTGQYEDKIRPAEKAVMLALPPMVMKSFGKLVAILFSAGVLKPADENGGLDVRVVIATLYASMVDIASAGGRIEVDKAHAKVNETLRSLMETATFAKGEDSAQPCGDPECEACSSKEEVAPVGVTKH